VRVEGLSQIGSKLENLSVNKNLSHEDGVIAGCRGEPKGQQPTGGQGAAAEGRTQAARVT
jgi:hypothetical protein